MKADMLGELVDQRLVALVPWVQHDERSDDLAPFRIRLADHCAFSDGLVLEQAGFDIEGADPVAGRRS